MNQLRRPNDLRAKTFHKDRVLFSSQPNQGGTVRDYKNRGVADGSSVPGTWMTFLVPAPVYSPNPRTLTSDP